MPKCGTYCWCHENAGSKCWICSKINAANVGPWLCDSPKFSAVAHPHVQTTLASYSNLWFHAKSLVQKWSPLLPQVIYQCKAWGPASSPCTYFLGRYSIWHACSVPSCSQSRHGVQVYSKAYVIFDVCSLKTHGAFAEPHPVHFLLAPAHVSVPSSDMLSLITACFYSRTAL